MKLSEISYNHVAGVPFAIRLHKDSIRKHVFRVYRFSPDINLAEEIAPQLSRKIRKLTPYNSTGYETILLLESSDIALMNDTIMCEAVQAALPRVKKPHPDHIWYADTSMPEIEFSLIKNI